MKLRKLFRYRAWYDLISRELFLRFRGRKTQKLGKPILVPKPVPDILYNQSVYNYLMTWIYVQGYEVYLTHDSRISRIGISSFDDVRLMIDELLNKYFDEVEKTKCKASPMAMFYLYDYTAVQKHRRKIAILALDETKFTCVQIPTKKYYDSYFG